MVVSKIVGIGMTSQRARNRLVEKIRSMGITNEKILEVMRLTPRHYFLKKLWQAELMTTLPCRLDTDRLSLNLIW